MKKLEGQQMEAIEGGKFWGRSETTCVADGQVFNPSTGGYDTTYMTCEHVYRFWIDFGDCWVSYGCD